jgi:hypothetical protein
MALNFAINLCYLCGQYFEPKKTRDGSFHELVLYLLPSIGIEERFGSFNLICEAIDFHARLHETES